MTKSKILLVVWLSVCGALWSAAEPGRRHDREFWRGIAASEFAVPEGETAMGLLRELSGMLGSRDPEERDTFGYGITVRWVYVQRLLSAEELEELMGLWTGNLRKGIGETGGDSVLLRSFSALDLSILAALDNEAPFLEPGEFRGLLDAALEYFERERDVRGYDPEVGWMHSVAHTSDLLKFLGRSRHLDAAGQARILRAMGSKLAAPDGSVYVFGEDERMARAVLSLLHREDLDRAGFQSWLEERAARAEGLWEGTLETARFAEVQNAKNLLRSLFVILSLEAAKEGAPAGIHDLHEAVLRTLSGM